MGPLHPLKCTTQPGPAARATRSEARRVRGNARRKRMRVRPRRLHRWAVAHVEHVLREPRGARRVWEERARRLRARRRALGKVNLAPRLVVDGPADLPRARRVRR